MRTSYSSIQTYLQCPQKYKFQEIDRIRSPKSKEAVFGTLIHSTLKYMFQKDPLFPTLEEVIAHFRENFSHAYTSDSDSEDGDELPQETKNGMRVVQWTDEEKKIYLEEGTRMLKSFYEKNAPWNFSIVDLESRFEIALTDEKTGATHILAGIIDRIDKLPDGSYEIIDYKTGKRMPSQDAINEDLQLSVYSLGLQKRWPHIKTEDIKLSLYFLKHGEKLSTLASPANITNTQQHVLSTINEIETRLRENKYFEPIPNALCDWCAYKPLCPAWKHLYRNKHQPHEKIVIDIKNVLQEYFELKSGVQRNEKRIDELQGQIKEYMAQEGLTRVFGDEGMLSQKTVQRYAYDFEKIKSILSPLGKWEILLEADETKLRALLKELPQEVRSQIEDARHVAKEYTTLTASNKKPHLE